jgi:MFS transporter, DHA1 family, multidrug resistance protein
MDLFREAPAGQLIRWITRKRFLKYPEEREDFVCPSTYQDGLGHSEPDIAPADSNLDDKEKEGKEELSETPSMSELNKIPTADDGAHLEGIHTVRSSRSRTTRMVGTTSMDRQLTQADLDTALSAAFAGPQPSRPVIPSRLDDGTILVDWYTTDDPENPQNWTRGRKLFVTFLMW